MNLEFRSKVSYARRRPFVPQQPALPSCRHRECCQVDPPKPGSREMVINKKMICYCLHSRIMHIVEV